MSLTPPLGGMSLTPTDNLFTTLWQLVFICYHPISPPTVSMTTCIYLWPPNLPTHGIHVDLTDHMCWRQFDYTHTLPRVVGRAQVVTDFMPCTPNLKPPQHSGLGEITNKHPLKKAPENRRGFFYCNSGCLLTEYKSKAPSAYQYQLKYQYQPTIRRKSLI